MSATGRRFRRKARSVLLFLPEVPESASEAIKDGIAARNIVATTGRCPACGECCVPWPPAVEAGTLSVVRFEHRDGCVALLGEGGAP